MTEEIKYTIDDLIWDCNKYYKALEEIEKILNEAYRTGRRTLALAKIRDKIDEVLGND